MSKTTLTRILAGILITASDGFSIPVLKDGKWPQEISVFSKPVPPKGDGVFADQIITANTFVCQYHGEVLTLEEEERKYPDRYPDYCLQISPTLSIDGQDSGHWSRLINHDEKGNLQLHTDEDQRIAYFTANRDIDVDEELTFDYGVAYFIFRGITPAPGTESRSLELPQETLEEALAQTKPFTPTSRTEIEELFEEEDDDETIKSSLLRGFNYFADVVWSEDRESVSLPTSLKDGSTHVYNYKETSTEDLAALLGKLCDEAQREK